MTTTQLLDGSTKDSYSCAETAVFIRQALKEAFPQVKFSVKSKTYSGGASINVRWTDGPTPHEVERVAKFYEGASFDGMIDLKSYHSTEFRGRNVNFGADYVFCNRRCSPELLNRAYLRVCAKYGLDPQEFAHDWRRPSDWSHYDMQSLTHQLLSTMWPNGCVVTLKEAR